MAHSGARTRQRPFNLPAGYGRADFWGDAAAGAITATLLIPQAMAYSQLAGLPPEIGLYASMLPPVLYALVGSSRTLAVGPVAVASLMLAGSLGQFWTAGSPEYIAGALIIAAMTGLMLIIMGIARLGVVANFLSHPVLSGFTNAAALVIILSQVKHLVGYTTGPSGGTALPDLAVLPDLAALLARINPTTTLVGCSAALFLILVNRYGTRLLGLLHVDPSRRVVWTRLAPLLLVVLGTLVTAMFQLAETSAVAVTGYIPRGLPAMALPDLEPARWAQLFTAALAIALVSFVESLSIAKVLAARRREQIDPDRELLGLGLANLGAAITGASPVCGGFSRSAVNFEAGARSQIAAVWCAFLIVIAATFLTPLLYHLPTAVLAAIVMVSVAGLIDLHTLKLCWHYNRADAVALLVTFGVVLVADMETGIAAGVLLSLVIYLWRTSRPHVAVVGRVGNTEHFRNVERHVVTTYAGILAIRVDESLYFANTQTLETRLLNALAEQPDLRHVVLICSAVNSIDTSALETLQNLLVETRHIGVTIHLAEVKGPVMDRLERTDFPAQLSPGQIFLSAHSAIETLTHAP